MEKYSREPMAARKQPMINVALITLFILMPMSWLVSKSLDTARMAMPIFVYLMKSNYVTPQVIVNVFYEDVITASPEITEEFDKDWLE